MSEEVKDLSEAIKAAATAKEKAIITAEQLRRRTEVLNQAIAAAEQMSNSQDAATAELNASLGNPPDQPQ